MKNVDVFKEDMSPDDAHLKEYQVYKENRVLSEKDYQHYIMNRLEQDNGYRIRKATQFDRYYAMDREMLFEFLKTSQPDEMNALTKVYKDKTEDTIVAAINASATQSRGSMLATLKHGIELSNVHLTLMYTKPATSFNETLLQKYEQNIFSVMEEVWAKDDERVDLVIFLNGIAIISFELKCEAAGQTYQNAIYQYRKERDPKARLFLFKAGCLVNFAMDLQEVYMTTKLAGEDTFFLPFNQGNGEGINAGAGNPVYDDRFSVSYMWEDILKKDTLLELIGKFMFIETKDETDEVTGKKRHKENLIFPRYHQLDCIRKILADVEENKTTQNYLIQHSTGSGKTNTIAWLAHRLTSLHDSDDRIIYDNIIIMTDRVVVDRQLQQAILGIEHKSGLIRVMDDKCTSADLKRALESNTKIIVSTIQKFPYVLELIADDAKRGNATSLSDKKFAIIIDEAHSSTSGKDMSAVTQVLASDNMESDDVQDVITKEIGKSGKQPNVSMFAFTATPKATTLRLFGRQNTHGQYEAFHLYSMKQAIEEGFILDVLSNYTTYHTYYEINKAIDEDPTLRTDSAKRQIARFVELHDTNIAQRVEVIIEHFRTTVMPELGGQAKAMVVTSSREAAVKYRQFFEKYTQKKGYTDIKALVAFSGKVTLKDGTEYTESSMNGFPEDRTAKEFDKPDYQVLLVANKYQTGFDQPKLSSMYILKKLHGVNAVQTLSRLNRICPPYDKKVFVLDFVNTYEDMQAAFAPYYTTTLLANTVNPDTIYDLEATIDGYYVIDPMDIEGVNDILYSDKRITSRGRMKLNYCFQKSKKQIENYPEEKQKEIIKTMQHFCRFYEFLIQVSCFKDVELHKKYNYINYLLAYVSVSRPGGGYNLDGKIRATNFVQKKESEHHNEKHTSNPVVKIPTAEAFGLSAAKEERLSQIIAEINARTGKSYDNDVAIKAALQVRDLMMKSDKLRTSAKNNTEKDFELSYYENIDDALIDGLEQNQDFFTLLLNTPELKKEVMGIFAESIYESLRNDDNDKRNKK